MARFDCFMLKSLSVEYGRTRQDLKCARAVFRPLFNFLYIVTGTVEGEGLVGL